MNNQRALLDYTLHLADDALIIGHRLSEWCGHGPILEQDIAITNTSLDHLGRARSLYQYAASIFNGMSAEEKKECFTSIAIQNIVNNGEQIDEDDLAYLRDGWDFRNIQLTEQPNNDWAYTVARSFFYDVFDFYLCTELQKSNDETLAAIAEKSLKEATYHVRWSSEWMIRLGDGTEESNKRLQAAVKDLWMFTGELVKMNDAEKVMLAAGTGVDLDAVKVLWQQQVATIFSEALIDTPPTAWMQEGGKDGRHTEHLGYILAELQFMQRAYPNMEW